MTMNLVELRNLVRTIPDFPKKGIQFRDITTLLLNGPAWRQVVSDLSRQYADAKIAKIVGIESRGFILGGAMAQTLGCGFVLARKRGKLPGASRRVSYALEYGEDAIEIHEGAIKSGERCLVVDDLIATGGTCEAACQLVEGFGGVVVGSAFIIALPDLGGQQRLERYKPHWLIEFGGH